MELFVEIIYSLKPLTIFGQKLPSLMFGRVLNTPLNLELALHEKCPYSEFFWSVFSSIQTEYGKILRIKSECGKIRTRKTPNTYTFYAVLNSHSVFHRKFGLQLYSCLSICMCLQ